MYASSRVWLLASFAKFGQLLGVLVTVRVLDCIPWMLIWPVFTALLRPYTHTDTHTYTHPQANTHTNKERASERERFLCVAVDAILCISMMRLFDFGIILAKPRSAFHAYKLLNYLSSDNDATTGGKGRGGVEIKESGKICRRSRRS